MKADIWMPLYPGDYLRDTAHLSTQQHGIYILLICHYWTTGTPIPCKLDQCRRIVKAFTPAEQEDLEFVLSEFFQKIDGKFHHKRINIELCKAKERQEKAVERGKKGAEKRWKD